MRDYIVSAEPATARLHHPSSILPPWSSATSQRLHWRVPRPRARKELDHVGVQRRCEALKDPDGRILEAALKPAHVCPIDSGVHRKVLLREISPDPEPTDVPRHKRPRLQR